MSWEKLMKEDLLAELDYSGIPNIDNMDKRYLELAEGFDPGNKSAGQ